MWPFWRLPRASIRSFRRFRFRARSVEAEPPTVTSVTPFTTVQPTDVTLTFDVQFANADGWKYICQKSDVEAPDAAKVFAEVRRVLGTSVTVEGRSTDGVYDLCGGLHRRGVQCGFTATGHDGCRALWIRTTTTMQESRLMASVMTRDSEGARLLEFASDATEDKLQMTFPGSATVSFIGKNESSYDLYTKRDGVRLLLQTMFL